jgi:hypothetical protein
VKHKQEIEDLEATYRTFVTKENADQMTKNLVTLEHPMKQIKIQERPEII